MRQRHFNAHHRSPYLASFPVMCMYCLLVSFSAVPVVHAPLEGDFALLDVKHVRRVLEVLVIVVADEESSHPRAVGNDPVQQGKH